MTGGVFSEKDGARCPTRSMVTLEYPDMLVNWQSTFSNSHYGLGEHILGDKGTDSACVGIERHGVRRNRYRRSLTCRRR